MLVTGDAVVLELPPAGLGTRLLAVIIDVVAQLLLLAGWVWAFGVLLLALDEAAIAAFVVALGRAVPRGAPRDRRDADPRPVAGQARARPARGPRRRRPGAQPAGRGPGARRGRRDVPRPRCRVGAVRAGDAALQAARRHAGGHVRDQRADRPGVGADGADAAGARRLGRRGRPGPGAGPAVPGGPLVPGPGRVADPAARARSSAPGWPRTCRGSSPPPRPPARTGSASSPRSWPSAASATCAASPPSRPSCAGCGTWPTTRAERAQPVDARTAPPVG